MMKNKGAKITDKIMTVVLYCVSIFFVMLLVGLCAYIIIEGFLVFEWEFLSFDSTTGIGSQLFNTIYLVFLSLLITTPIGICAGIFLAEYAQEGKITSTIKVCIQTLSSLPSVVVGLFGAMFFVTITGGSWNLFAGALTLSVLNLPLVVTTTIDAFNELPKSYKQGSMCLGATHFQSVVKVLLPACMPRILTGIILAAGRGFGETAALLFTSGQSTNISWDKAFNFLDPRCPFNPFRSGETLSLHIWMLKSEGTNPKATEIAAFASAVLIILVLVFSLTARALSSRLDRKNLGITKEKKKK